MPVKAIRGAIEQLELFRAPPSLPLWSDLPKRVRGEVRELVSQMLRAHTDAGPADELEGEGNDD